jgi:hypothetical protein
VGNDLDLGVLDDLIDVVGQHARGQVAVARLLEIADDGFLEPKNSPRVSRGAVAVVEQQTCHAAADGAEADDGNFGGFHARCSAVQDRDNRWSRS